MNTLDAERVGTLVPVGAGSSGRTPGRHVSRDIGRSSRTAGHRLPIDDKATTRT
ncbi:hypothetical protein [Myceligenerans indicum]|uniref:Uncharacterized protein n=1 Tax=Myceligenerans indicum TaxID=2593663 RepID=A0ABS1LTP1_9MICO|nr:hypothetical protein [Myceligenerans indicum]MBL0888857.1 hypothetical protein [Myceligenerans indicum]